MSVRIIVGNRTDVGRFKPGVHAYREPMPHWDKAWLVERYVDQRRTAADIAEEIGCGESNVDYWLKKHGVQRRTISEVRALKHWGAAGPANPMFGKFGVLNPNYVDGGSPERQRLYATAKGRSFIKAVLARDGYRCVRCGAPKTTPRSLHVHHLKPWAGNPKLRFRKSNGVTLCRGCHGWVHSRKNVRRDYLR